MQASVVNSSTCYSLAVSLNMSAVWRAVETAFSDWLTTNAEFSCEYCQIKFQHENTLVQHIEEVHRVSFAKYMTDNPNYILNESNNWCRMCQEEALDIYCHLKQSHFGMSSELYFMRYIFEEVGTADNQLKIIVLGSEDNKIDPTMYQHKNIRSALMAPYDNRSLMLNISLATGNNYSMYNFENVSWLDSRMPVHIAKPVTLLSISEFGGTVASNAQIASGTYLFLRGDIYDQAPRRNLCARFYASEPMDDGPYKYKCHLLYFGINEAFMKFARSWFRETYAASKQSNG